MMNAERLRNFNAYHVERNAENDAAGVILACFDLIERGGAGSTVLAAYAFDSMEAARVLAAWIMTQPRRAE